MRPRGPTARHALALTLAELLTGDPPDRVDLTHAGLPPPLAQVLTTALHTADLATPKPPPTPDEAPRFADRY